MRQKIASVFNETDAQAVYDFLRELEYNKIIKRTYHSFDGEKFIFGNKDDYNIFWNIITEESFLDPEHMEEAKDMLNDCIDYVDNNQEPISKDDLYDFWAGREEWIYNECYENYPDWLIDTSCVTYGNFDIREHINENDNNYYLNIGTNQYWNGESSGWSFCESFLDCLPHTEDLEMKYDVDENGIKYILIHGIHHDGTNIRKIYLFDKDKFDKDNESKGDEEIEELKHIKSVVMNYVVSMSEDCDIIN